MSTASKAAQHKEVHPDWYCTAKHCLWFTGRGKVCPKHNQVAPYKAQAQRIADTYNRLAAAEQHLEGGLNE